MNPRRWHRRIGLAAALFLAWLALTGIAIHHAASLGLDAMSLRSPWLLKHYGLYEHPAAGFESAGHRLIASEAGAVLDGRTLKPALIGTRGFVAVADVLFVATDDSIELLTADGERIESLRPPALPVSTLSRIGLVEGKAVIEGKDGLIFASADGDAWTAVSDSSATDVQWSQPKTLPLSAGEGAAISANQVLLDAHSGRLFGRLGPYFVDIVGGLAILLALTGVWVWWRSPRR